MLSCNHFEAAAAGKMVSVAEIVTSRPYLLLDTDFKGRSLLMVACIHQRVEMATFLLDTLSSLPPKSLSAAEFKRCLILEDESHQTAFEYAIQFQLWPIIERMAPILAQIDRLNHSGSLRNTPIHRAVIQGDRRLVRFLFQTDNRILRQAGECMIKLALQHSPAEILPELASLDFHWFYHSCNRSDSPLQLAARNQSVLRLMYNLLENEGDRDCVIELGSKFHHFEILTTLIHSDFEWFYSRCIQDGSFTLFHHASRSGFNSILQFAFNLIQERKGRAAVIKCSQIRNQWGETPIFDAVKSENIETVNLLLRAGADINSFAGRYQTPLSSVVSLCQFEMVKHLLRCGSWGNIRVNRLSPVHTKMADLMDAINNRSLGQDSISDQKALKIRFLIYFQPSLLWRLMIYIE